MRFLGLAALSVLVCALGACEQGVAPPTKVPPFALPSAEESERQRDIAAQIELNRQANDAQTAAVSPPPPAPVAESEPASSAAQEASARMADTYEARHAELEAKCAAQKTNPPEPSAPSQADLDRIKHRAWVHDHCGSVQPEPVVNCNPVCIATPQCLRWTCSAHRDWAEETTMLDCIGYATSSNGAPARAARRISTDDPCEQLKLWDSVNGRRDVPPAASRF